MSRLIVRSFSHRLGSTRRCSVALMVAAVLVVGLLDACSALPRTASSTNAVAPAPSSGKELQAPGSAPAPGAGGAADAGGTSLPTAGSTRSIIRTGSLDLVVRSVTDAMASVNQIATAVNGNVSDSSFAGTAGQQSATFTLRVPVARLAEAIAKLQALAVEVRTSTTTSRDVTDEVTDVEATLRNLRAVEAQYVQLLGRTGSIAEVLQVQDRLNQVRLQIDRTEARRQLLASQAEMATLTVELHPEGSLAPVGGGPLAAARAAWVASLRTLELLGTAVLVTVVYLWWLLPFLAAGVWYAVRFVRRERAASAAVVPVDPPSA